VPLLFVMALRMRKIVYPSSWDAQQRAAEVATVVDEAVSGVRVVKGFGQERRELARLTDAALNLFGSRMRNVRISAKRQATMQVVPSLSQVLILALGGWLVIHDQITLGTFLAFQSYLLQLVAPVRQMAGMLVMAQTARAAAERIYELLDSTSDVEEKDDAVELDDGAVQGEVVFRDVSFGYLRSEPVLRSFDLRVAPGETVALVGTSGSGKSTVSLLLPRFYDVQAGSITIDGIDVRDVTMQSLRRQIGVVFEESFLFSDSVSSNIAYGKPDATEDEIVAAAKAARAHDFITALPDGYDTLVGERGLTLSGGQRQRLALARALLTDPRILLLDDATSSVDVRLEEEIHATLRELMDGRTTLLVAHRRSTLHLADRIVLLDGGGVVDSGGHEELLERCRLYRELLAGPGDDLETVTPEGGELGVGSNDGGAVVVETAGVTTSAWQQPVDEDGTVAAAQRAAYAKMRESMGRGGGGMGGGGGGGGFAGRLSAPPTPELMAQIEALPPIIDRPSIDLEEQTRPQPDFSLRRLLAPRRSQLVVASVLVGANALAALAGPFLIRLGVDHGVTQDDQRWLWLASSLYVASVIVSRALSWIAASSPAGSVRRCCCRCAFASSPTCSASASTSTTGRWRAGS
jgi:ATP-binding cassette, subfamily B, bacterial